MNASDVTKHTPGPWHVEAWDDGARLSVTAGDTTADGDVIAWIDSVMPAGATEANARLIASAPDLLAQRDEARAQVEALAVALRASADALAVADADLDDAGDDDGCMHARQAERDARAALALVEPLLDGDQ